MIHIKIFGGMVRKLKEVRYVPQLKRNIISVGALKALVLQVSIGDGVLKMTIGSRVGLKGIRRNNFKGSMVTEQVATSSDSDDDCTRLWQIRLRHTGKSHCKLLQSKVY